MPDAHTPDESTSLPVLKRFLGIDEADDRLLREWGARVSAADRQSFVDRFYEHLGAFPELVGILSVPGRPDGLRRSMARYLDSLLTAPVNDAYLTDRVLTGQAHVRVGLPPRWYLGAYAFFVDAWLPRFSDDPDDRARVRALLKRMLLDSLLAMESYVSGRVEGLAREREGLVQEVLDRARRLDESEKRYEDLVENAPEMIHQVDADRRFLGVNRTELARLGYTLAEMQQMKLEMIVPPAYRHGIIEHVERVQRDGASRLETIFQAKSGEEFPVEIYATAQHDADGRFVRTRAFVRDLSERRRLQGELARWERLATVGSMAAKVAHEIRNPLSAILLNVEILSDEIGELPEERRRGMEPLLSTILGGVDRLNAITEEYLSFARLPPMEMHETSLQEVFHRLGRLVRPDLHRHDIHLVVDLPPELPEVTADAQQLIQVFLNLIRNSQDAMPTGGTIRVEGRYEADSVEITLRDGGVGIPESSLAKIFDPFFTTKDSGTGLGLAYVQQVLLEHRARITCTSRPGEGTLFRIVFPPHGRARAGQPPAREGGS